MKVLGLVGSRRKLGNTEILVKEALKGAREEGADIAIMRVSDCYLQECNGCMACMIRKERCRLKDDMDFLGSELESADGLVMGAPSYHYRPPGIVLVADDRVPGLVRQEKPGKMAITIGTAAKYERAGWVIPLLNKFVRSVGFELVGSFLAISPGPGEVLLPDRQAIPQEVNRMGRDLVFSLRGEKDRLSDGVNRLRVFNPHSEGERLFTPDNCCPFCFSTAFHLIGPDEVQCAFCFDSTGRVVWENDRVKIQFRTLTEEESKGSLERHRASWIAPTGGWFQQHRAEIDALRAPYSNIGIPWLQPPRAES